jgi:hypothetical protein
MTEPAELAPPRKRRRWRRLLLLLVPLALLAGAYLYLFYAGDLRLQRAISEADHLDPHWRLDDLLAERADIPDEENGALTVLAAKAKRPPAWPAWEVGPPGAGAPERSLAEVLGDLKPNEVLNEKERAAVRAEVERAADAITEARKLADQPRGRFAITYSKDFISTLMTGVQDAREAAHLLSYDALSRAQDGDLRGAAVSCRALVNAGRAIGDEPTLIAALVRMALRAIAVGQSERVLGQGALPDEDLASLQKAFEEEAEERLFPVALRGERGGMDRFMQALQRGDLSVKQMQGLTAGRPASSPRWFAEEKLLYLPGAVTNSRAAMLERMNRLVEISKLPPEEQAAPLAEMQASLPRQLVLVRELEPAVEKVAGAERRTLAQLRCAATALAAERYRLKHGRWPESLADLKGEFLRDVPADPFDGKPLRYRRDGEGVVVYAVGPDGKDDGGDRATLNTHKDGTDLGFRLWDVDKRRQPRK